MKIAILTTEGRDYYRRYQEVTPTFGTAPDALLQGFAQLPEIQVHVVSCAQQPMKSPSKLAENIFFHSLVVPKIGWMRTGYQGCISAVRRKMREIKPDIVHGQGTERDCAISAVFSGFPNVITIHGNMRAVARVSGARPFSYQWLNARLESFTLPRAGGVLCNSAYTEAQVRPCNPRTWRVPNPLRSIFLEQPLALHLANPVPRIINVGHVCTWKRQVELLAMAKRLHEEGLRFQFEFVGHAEPGNAYAEKFLEGIRAAEPQGYAIYSGSKDAPALVAALDQADACLHFPTEEAFGLVVAEALARNLKFIGAKTGGIGDIASGVDGAELVETEDWTGLARALRFWIERGSPKPTGAAKQMAILYHPQVVAAQHVEIYREVLARPPA